MLQQVLEAFGPGNGVLFEDILKRHDNVGVGDVAQGWWLGEVGQRAGSRDAAKRAAAERARGALHTRRSPLVGRQLTRRTDGWLVAHKCRRELQLELCFARRCYRRG